MMVFFLVMILHPEVQRWAQAEIDHVVGKGFLPSIHNEKDLPYIMAIIKELFRWAPVVPLGTYVCFLNARFFPDVFDARSLPSRYAR